MLCKFAATYDNIMKLWKERVFLSYGMPKASQIAAPKTYLFNDSCVLAAGGGGVGFWGMQTIFSMGAYSYSFSGFSVNMKVGAYCSIAVGSKIRAINHPCERFTTSPLIYDPYTPLNPKREFKQVCFNDSKYNMPIIESDVWMGGECLLSPNITLGAGCVVAARSNVTKSVHPYAIVGGNPAKVIKYRFADGIIERLLASRWWEYDITYLPCAGDAGPEQFLDTFAEHKNKCPKLQSRLFTDILKSNDIAWEKA